MQKLHLIWEKGKGYQLIIDDISFEKLVSNFEITGEGSSAPVVRIELIGSEKLSAEKIGF